MNYLTHNQKDDINVMGTSLSGYVDTTYAALKEMFGEPEEGDGYKVDAEWVLEFKDGTVVTIYNYKDGVNYLGAEEGIETQNITDWHIGGGNNAEIKLLKSTGLKGTYRKAY